METRILDAGTSLRHNLHHFRDYPLSKHGARKPESVGMMQWVEVTVLDGDNAQLVVGKVGGVYIRGGNVTAGYNNNAEANKSAFAGEWFHTGDQGRIDVDEYMTLTGWINELVNTAVILMDGCEVGSDELGAFAKERLATFKVPKRFFVCLVLPRTATEKIRRRIVPKHFLDKLAGDGGES